MEICSFNPDHEDLLHDLYFDYYGKRIVTCSSDHKLKVWDQEPQKDGGYKWVLNDVWKAHDASVLKVRWAHPEFGQVLVSCSFDRSIRIWEEQEQGKCMEIIEEPKQSGKRWLEKARLLDSRGTVQDVKFASHHLGLKLATVSVDGVLRIYEALDVANLAHWTLTDEIEIGTFGHEKETEYCLSWCPSRFLPQMLAVGCGKEHTVKIYRLDETNRKWQSSEVLPGHQGTVHDVHWAPTMGKSFHLIATACKDKYLRIFKLQESEEDGKFKFKVELVAELNQHHSEVWRVEWNLTGTVLSSSGDDGRIILWKSNYLGEWQPMSVIQGDQTIDSSLLLR